MNNVLHKWSWRIWPKCIITIESSQVLSSGDVLRFIYGQGGLFGRLHLLIAIGFGLINLNVQDEPDVSLEISLDRVGRRIGWMFIIVTGIYLSSTFFPGLRGFLSGSPTHVWTALWHSSIVLIPYGFFTFFVWTASHYCTARIRRGLVRNLGS